MGIFDRVRQAFRGKTASAQPDEVKTVEAARIPEQVSISPLPQSIRGMEKGRNIDRLGMMKAQHIGFAPSFGPDQKGFWEYKKEQRTGGHSKADYLEMASHIPEVRERLNNGESLQSLMQDARVGACATQYFSPENMIQVESYPDGHYEYSTGGRHRIAAAQELGIEIPVQVNEYGNKDGYSISPWEKQERYDALMDYMKEHNYGESDRAVYEADPEWQRLNKAYNHPVNDWEQQELSDWEKSADSLLSQRYEEMHPTDASMTSQGSSQAESAQGYSQATTLGDRYQSAYADRIRQTPSLESNRWAGERGESICAPQSDASRQILEERGLAGVTYQNGVPDFSPFSESTVKLGYMTDARHSRGLVDGRDSKNAVYAHFEDGELVSSSHRADKGSMADLHMKYDKPGDFEQADALTAEQWTADGKDDREWTADDVAQYRKDNGLTWHECNDRETMQMVPEAINADFGHLGGVAEVKETQRIIDEVLSQEDDGDWLEGDDFDRMSKEELESFNRENGHYDDEGIWIPDDEAELPEPLTDKPEEIPLESMIDKPEELPLEPMIDKPEEIPLEPIIDKPAEETLDDPGEEPVEAQVHELVDELKPSDNPVEEPIDEPAEASIDAPVEEPIDEPAEEPVEEPIDEPAEELVEEPIDEPAEEPVEEPIDEPAEEPVEKPIDEPAEEPVEEPIDEPAEEPAEDPIDEPAEEPVEDPIDEPAEESVKESIDEPAEEPVEEPIDEPAEEPVKESIDEPAEEPVEEPIDEPAEESAEEPIDEPAEEPVEKPIDEPAEEPVEEPIDEPAEEPVEEPIDEPAEEPIDEPSEEPVEEPIDEPAEEPVEEPIDEPVEEPVEAPIDEPAEEPVEESIDEHVEESVEESIDEHVEEPVEDPIDEHVEEPVEERIDEPTEEAVEEPIDEPAEEPVEEPIDEPAEEPVEEPIDNFSDVDESSDDSDVPEDYTDLSDEDDGMQDEATDSYDDLSDEVVVDEYDTSEDFSDLSDDVNDDFVDDSDDSDYSDDVAEEPVDFSDYSDISDDVDSGSYDDSSFDSGDVSVDSGDSGSFDGGGDSIE